MCVLVVLKMTAAQQLNEYFISPTETHIILPYDTDDLYQCMPHTICEEYFQVSYWGLLLCLCLSFYSLTCTDDSQIEKFRYVDKINKTYIKKSKIFSL